MTFYFGDILPISRGDERRGAATAEFDFMDERYPIQVKQKDKVGRPDVDSFEAVMSRFCERDIALSLT